MTLTIAIFLHRTFRCRWLLQRAVFRRLRPEDRGEHR